MNMKRCSLLVLPLIAMTGLAQAQSMGGAMRPRMSAMDMRARNAQMLIQTLSEEKTEINTLAAQQAHFRRLGGADNNRIARMFGVWIAEHKAGSPVLMRLIRQNGGDPGQARILKQPVLGSKMTMLMATHRDHEAAVRTSQMRHGLANSAAIKKAMRKRAKLARKHIKQMAPWHDEMMRMGMGAG